MPNPLKGNFVTNKTVDWNLDDTWSMDFLDLEDYGVKNIESNWYTLVVFDNFSEFD